MPRKNQKINVRVYTMPHPNPAAAIRLVAEIVTKQLINNPELLEQKPQSVKK